MFAHAATFWSGPPGHRHAAVLVGALVAVGGVLQGTGGPPRPEAAAVLALPLILVGVAGARSRRPWLAWPSTGAFGVSAMVALALLALVGGLVPSGVLAEALGGPLWSSWPFVLTLAAVETNLLGTVLRRPRGTRFVLNHLGLALLVLGAAVTTVGADRAQVRLEEGVPARVATRPDGSPMGLPYTLRLREFRIEYWPPTLALATRDSTLAAPETPATGTTLHAGGLAIEVERFLPHAAEVGGEWREIPWPTAPPAALIRVGDHRGWVSCGSREMAAQALDLDAHRAVLMLPLKPRRFTSRVEVDGESREIAVNAPLRRGGDTIFQFAYEDDRPILEVSRDPGIPVVYAGLAMLLAAAALSLAKGSLR